MLLIGRMHKTLKCVIPRWFLIGLLATAWIDYPRDLLTADVTSSADPRSEMVLIPAGQFQMGSDNGRSDEAPVYQVWVDAFYIGRYEVANADYQAFILANPQWQKASVKKRDYLKHWQGNTFPPGMDKYPVTYVTHEAAEAYCQWRGKRLPSEAEWEKASRGEKPNCLYPWGNQVDADAANYDAIGVRKGEVEHMLRFLKPVGSFTPNTYMLYDMGGNVAEWCADRYVPYTHRLNHVTHPANTPFVVRGGSWFDPIFDLRCTARAYALSGAYSHIGFRCARDGGEKEKRLEGGKHEGTEEKGKGK